MAGVDAGIAKIVGSASVQNIVREASQLLQNANGIYDVMTQPKFPYGNGTAAKQIVSILYSRMELNHSTQR